MDRKQRHKGWSGLLRLSMELKSQECDLAVLFQNAFEAALIAWLSGIPLRLGYNTDARRFLLNRAVKLNAEDKQVHETEYYLRILSKAGLQAPWSPPVFHLAPEMSARAEAWLAEFSPEKPFLLGLAPGAAYGSAKQWPADRFAAAARMILSVRPGRALIFGSQSETEVAARVSENLGSAAVDLSGRTGLAEAAALIKRCHLFLTNDSGLMHVAAAVGTPLVAVFGSTNPKTTAPVGQMVKMIRHPVTCAPCLKPICTQPTHSCMEAVTPAEVATAGLELMNSFKE
ncbi:MAG: lipopolysaccharide heptosyltransferase II [Deltaproteobacteria bacterium]|nr:lipopolysaccharide heptosyltransferase II [Deltaproteobacteria bacterium]